MLGATVSSEPNGYATISEFVTSPSWEFAVPASLSDQRLTTRVSTSPMTRPERTLPKSLFGERQEKVDADSYDSTVDPLGKWMSNQEIRLQCPSL